MKTITNNVALLLSFFVYLSFLPSLNADSNNTLIAETCQKVKNKDLFISSLEAEQASQEADLSTLALISIKVATNNGSDTSVYIKKTLDGTDFEPAVEQNFEDCSENYESAMEQLDDSLLALLSMNYKDAKTWLQAAIDDATTCENGMKQSDADKLELSSKNDIFLKLCSNALDIINILATK
ncbi:hypothetical protein REPUB_Repub12eG0151400 [Reevesia pubescens]